MMDEALVGAGAGGSGSCWCVGAGAVRETSLGA